MAPVAGEAGSGERGTLPRPLYPPHQGGLRTSSPSTLAVASGDAEYDHIIKETLLAMDTAGRFSDLLWMPHSQHKISKAWEDPDNCLNMRCHRVGIPFDPLCSSALENLGFYQIAKMKKINVDKYLISALVERWHPETNSFHLPVGEMTVTLQDVSCLWGLPIRGKPLIYWQSRCIMV